MSPTRPAPIEAAVDVALDAHFSRCHGVITRSQAMACGLRGTQITNRVTSRRWAVVHRGVYRRSGHELSFEGQLLAACLAAGPGALACDLSALWLWRLSTAAPASPSIAVPSHQRPRLHGVTVRRRADLDPGRRSVLRHIPVTDPLRSLCEAAAGMSGAQLDGAIDRALAIRLVTVEALLAEADRLARAGKAGVAALRRALRRRGFVDAPGPSVLESRTVRLLSSWGIEPLGCQVVTVGGRYRLDFLLAPGVALEVDGFAYHSSPEAKGADSRRRNRLRRAGLDVVESDWLEVTRHPRRLRATIDAALGAGLACPQPDGPQAPRAPQASKSSTTLTSPG